MISPSEAASLEVQADYFDGRQATRHQVAITVAGGTLHVHGGMIARSEPLTAIEITQPLGTAPRLVRFRDGAFCAVERHLEFAALLAAHGIAPARVTRLEGSSRWVVIAIVTFLVVLLAGYRYGLPLAARVAAHRMPPRVSAIISSQALATFDRTVFSRSRVPLVRQAAIRRRFAALRLPDDSNPEGYTVLFRDSPILQANALALPSGQLILTDALVGLTQDDSDLVAVLAHEMGHVEGHHSLRQLFQSSVVGLAITWFIGDVSVLAATAPTVLLQAKYSRDFERDADAFAIGLLDANHIPREHFARMLERLGQSARRRTGAFAGERFSEYISSHPVTAERLEALRTR